MELRRKTYQELVDWKNRSNGRTALLIEGARRVGKSYIAKQFAQNEYRSYILIDFSLAGRQLLDLFENMVDDLDTFFLYLSQYTSTRLYPRQSLIIFDEVQIYPRARQLIKHFVADGRFDYLETGSLISIKRNIQDILIPSEEEGIRMHPLDFEEFLWALGDSITVPFLEKCYRQRKPVGDAIHRKTMNLFKQYMIVGGMPQVVLAYLETNDFERCDKVKRDILRLYKSDIPKFTGANESKVMLIFDDIPAQLSKAEKKFTLASIEKQARYRVYEDSFVWLSEAMIVNLCLNATDPHVGLGLYKDRLTLKMYMADTGLLIAHAFANNKVTSNEIYRGILYDQLELNNGMLFENIVAQMLVSNGHQLYFYSRHDNHDAANKMEIDFLVSLGDRVNRKVCPIEVKSSKRYRLSSLKKFISKFRSRIGQQFVIHTKDLKVDDQVIFLPVYMAMFL